MSCKVACSVFINHFKCVKDGVMCERQLVQIPFINLQCPDLQIENKKKEAHLYHNRIKDFSSDHFLKQYCKLDK